MKCERWKPSTEDVAELNKLYGSLRRLKAKEKTEREILMEPVRVRIAEVNKLIDLRYSKDLRELRDKIYAMKSKFHIKLDWRLGS